MKNKRIYKSLISFATIIAILAISFSSLTVAAAQYSGGCGTLTDPYLIKTADDLYNMRNNLSAHFKLAATIDMKGYKTDSKYFNKGFVPIGDDSTKPFTGSFTCDLASDGLPLYAILNLNIYNKKGEIFKHDWYGESDYPDALGQPEPYFWQTALFGTTSGASISNIYVLNAKVYSSVVGQHDGRYTEGTNKIMYGNLVDRMSTGILIGEAINTSVSHCAATGSVMGKTSRHAGFIGAVKDSNIENSYANIKIDTGGCWHIGGFVGHLSGMSTIRNCFSTGSLNASMDGYGKMLTVGASIGSGCGGFVGTIDPAGSIIENCYSSINLTSKTRGNNFLGQNRDPSATVKNCFTYGKYDGKKSTPSGTDNENNCYIATESKGLQADFNAASADKITKYFTSISGWAKGDKYPVLSAVNIVKDDGIFKVGEEREKAPSNQQTNTSSSTSSQTTDSNQNTSSTVSSSQTNNNSQSVTVSQDNSSSTVSNSSQAENTTSEQTTVEEVNVGSDDEIDIVQLVLIVVISIIIIGNCVLTVAIAHGTLKSTKKLEENDEFEGDVQDE